MANVIQPQMNPLAMQAIAQAYQDRRDRFDDRRDLVDNRQSLALVNMLMQQQAQQAALAQRSTEHSDLLEQRKLESQRSNQLAQQGAETQRLLVQGQQDAAKRDADFRSLMERGNQERDKATLEFRRDMMEMEKRGIRLAEQTHITQQYQNFVMGPLADYDRNIVGPAKLDYQNRVMDMRDSGVDLARPIITKLNTLHRKSRGEFDSVLANLPNELSSLVANGDNPIQVSSAIDLVVQTLGRPEITERAGDTESFDVVRTELGFLQSRYAREARAAEFRGQSALDTDLARRRSEFKNYGFEGFTNALETGNPNEMHSRLIESRRNLSLLDPEAITESAIPNTSFEGLPVTRPGFDLSKSAPSGPSLSTRERQEQDDEAAHQRAVENIHRAAEQGHGFDALGLALKETAGVIGRDIRSDFQGLSQILAGGFAPREKKSPPPSGSPQTGGRTLPLDNGPVGPPAPQLPFDQIPQPVNPYTPQLGLLPQFGPMLTQFPQAQQLYQAPPQTLTEALRR
jgi:hypothetical protein